MFHRDLMASFPVSEHHFFPVNFRSGKHTSDTLRLCWEKCTQHISLHKGRQNYSIPRMSYALSSCPQQSYRSRGAVHAASVHTCWLFWLHEEHLRETDAVRISSHSLKLEL